MKKTEIAGISAITILAFMSASCDMLEKIGISTGKEKIAKEAVLPTDRENIQTPASSKTYTPEELAKGIVRGDWAIETVDGKPAVGEKAPFLKFDPKTNRVYGNNGCNILNSTYKYNPKDSTISFSDAITTMMACGMEGITDIEINLALDKTRYYSWELKDSEYHLYFYDEARHQVMSLMHQNFSFLNGTWHVTAINGESVNVEGMNIVIDVDEGKVHGETGCNLLNGTLETDMETANSISFQAIGITRMACPDMNWETPLVVALEDAAFAKPVSASRVLLLDNQRKVVLQLDRVKVQ